MRYSKGISSVMTQLWQQLTGLELDISIKETVHIESEKWKVTINQRYRSASIMRFDTRLRYIVLWMVFCDNSFNLCSLFLPKKCRQILLWFYNMFTCLYLSLHSLPVDLGVCSSFT